MLCPNLWKVILGRGETAAIFLKMFEEQRRNRYQVGPSKSCTQTRGLYEPEQMIFPPSTRNNDMRPTLKGHLQVPRDAIPNSYCELAFLRGSLNGNSFHRADPRQEVGLYCAKS